MFLGCALLLVAGCGEPDVTPEERIASIRAYDSLLQALPEGIQQAMPAIDSLFLGYDRRWVAAVADTSGARRWVDSLMTRMSLDEKIGQLFIVHLNERGFSDAEAVRLHHVGGFLVPRTLEPRDVYRQTRRLQEASSIPLFFAADYERGVGRFDNALTELPSNMALGATRDTLFAAAAGRLTALEARAIGVNLLFAPVVDVNNNAANPIINIRSYGEDPELVGLMAAAFVREAQAYGLLTTLKHFPGHGNTSVDTHSRMGSIPGDSLDLERIELKPYRIALERPVKPAAVMTAHLWVPGLDRDPVPATFSHTVLGELLRKGISFDGLVITDDVRMGAVQQRYSARESVVGPLLAGADVILTPANVARAAADVRAAIQSGELTTSRLDESVRRVLTAKARAGLHRQPVADEAVLDYALSEPRGAYVAQAMADRSVTLLKDDGVLPLRLESRRIMTVHLSNFRGSESIHASMDLFDDLVGGWAAMRYDPDLSEAAATRVLERAAEADVIVVALYLRLQAGRGEAGLFPAQSRLVQRLLAAGRPVFLLTFGNPYAVASFPAADAILVSYDQSLQTIYAAAGVLTGRRRPVGRLPITVGPYPFGSGLDAGP